MVHHIPTRFAILFVAVLPACAVARPAERPSEDAARTSAFMEGVDALDRADFAHASDRLATVAAICPVDDLGRRAMLLLAASELDPRNGAGRAGVAAELTAFQIVRPTPTADGSTSLARELHVLSLDYGAPAVAAPNLPDARVLWTHYLGGGDGAAGLRRPLGAEADDATRSDAASQADARDVAAGPPMAAGPSVASRPSGGPLCDVPAADARVVLPELTGRPAVAGVAPGVDARPAPPSDPADVRALMAEVDRLRAQLAATEQELDRIRRTLRP